MAPREYADYAYYDQSFALLDSLHKDLKTHLRPGGRCLLAYGCKEAIETAFRLADRYGLTVTILDDRPLDELPADFLPGILLEIRVKTG